MKTFANHITKFTEENMFTVIFFIKDYIFHLQNGNEIFPDKNTVKTLSLSEKNQLQIITDSIKTYDFTTQLKIMEVLYNALYHFGSSHQTKTLSHVQDEYDLLKTSVENEGFSFLYGDKEEFQKLKDSQFIKRKITLSNGVSVNLYLYESHLEEIKNLAGITRKPRPH